MNFMRQDKLVIVSRRDYDSPVVGLMSPLSALNVVVLPEKQTPPARISISQFHSLIR
jgi:hypothetical protein